MDDLLDALAGSKVYTILDLAQFYFQLRLDEASQDVCAFNTPYGLFAPSYVVQGDQSAPPVAQRIISQVLAGIPNVCMLIDDIAIGTTTTDEMFVTLRQVFDRLSQYNLRLKPIKAHLFTDKIPFLGHNIQAGKLIQSEEKVERVRKWPRPRSSREIKKFLGFLGFWRAFIKGMSHHAKPLIDLQNAVNGRIKDEDWLPVHQQAFDKLKELAITAPVLHLFEVGGGRAHLYADASEVALGALLAQEVFNGTRWETHPVAYASRLLRGAENRYDISDLEGLAVLWSIKKFRPYLYGAEFDLHTDSQTVYQLFRKPEPDLGKRLGRYHAMLLGYSFRIFHVKGHRNPSDALSRLPTVRNKQTGELEYLEEDLVLEKKATGEEDTLENEDEEELVAAIEEEELLDWIHQVEEEEPEDPQARIVTVPEEETESTVLPGKKQVTTHTGKESDVESEVVTETKEMVSTGKRYQSATAERKASTGMRCHPAHTGKKSSENHKVPTGERHLSAYTGEESSQNPQQQASHSEVSTGKKDTSTFTGKESKIVMAVQTRAQKRLMGYEDIVRQQQEDADLKPIFAALKKNIAHEVQGMTYFVKGGAMFVTDKKNRERLVVPSGAVRDLLTEKHSLPETGHPGATKLYEELSEELYWKGMQEAIARFVRYGDTGQRHKTTYEHLKTPLGSLPRPTTGFEVMAMDVIGPYNQRADRNRYAIIVVDLFTRYAWARAMPNQTGKNIAEFLHNEVFKFGTPKAILSDQGRNVDEGVVAELTALMGVKKLRSSPYFPSGNGAAERLCGTLGTMVRLAAADTQQAWSKLLPVLVTKYNNTRHRATREKPVVVAFGREPLQRDPLVPTTRKRFTGQGDYIRDLRQRRARAEELAQKALETYYEKAKEDHDAATRARPHSFTLGQYVLVKKIPTTPGESKKLEPRYYGPAEIMEVGEHTAKIRFVSNGFTRIRNVSHLRPYFWDSEDPIVLTRFTAPKRRNKRFDTEDDVEESREQETQDATDLVTGILDSSPYRSLMKGRADKGADVDDDDDDVKQVTFTDENLTT